VIRLFITVALVVGALVYARQHNVLQQAHLLGRCAPIELSTPAPSGSVWRACTNGSLTGRPDLSARCKMAGMIADKQLWSCPETAIDPTTERMPQLVG
jgi:hypothetical protein